MGKISVVANTKILDHLLLNDAYSNNEVWVGLFNGNPESGGTECPGPEYVKVQCIGWNEADNWEITNLDRVVFPDVETDDWGIVDYVGLFDSAGNLIAYDDVESLDVSVGTKPVINSGELTISITSNCMDEALANKILNHLFGVESFDQPDYIVVGVSTTSITDSTDITEPNDNDYERKTCDSWNEAVSGQTSNNQVVTFETATTDWDIIVAGFVLLVNVGFLFASLNSSKEIISTERLQINGEEITIKIDE